MLPTIFALIHLALAGLQPGANWVDAQSLRISLQGQEELLERCIRSGIEVQYRYEMRYCRRRSAWFDNCEEVRMEIRSLQFDAVDETYHVAVDRHGDEKNPEHESYASMNDAKRRVMTIESVPLSFISRGVAVEAGKDNYVGIRVISECRGDIGGSLLDISYLLTFGLVKINRFDSGWIAFYLGDRN